MQVEDFLRKIPPLIFPFREDQGKDIQFNEKPEKEDTQLVKMEDLFSQLLSDMGSVFDRSFMFFKQMQKEFDQSFQTYFMSDLDLSESPSMPALPEAITRNDGLQKDWGIPAFLQTVFDFSKTVFEGVSEVITEVFDEYKDNRFARTSQRQVLEIKINCAVNDIKLLRTANPWLMVQSVVH